MFTGTFTHLCLKPKEGKQPNVGKSEMGVTSHCDLKNQSGRPNMGGREGKWRRKSKYERISIFGCFIFFY